MQDRNLESIERADLDRLAAIAAADRAARFDRVPRWRPYADRLICAALCQGAAVHFLDRSNGINDFDVWSFFADHPVGRFPQRWRTVADFGESRFGRTTGAPAAFRGRRVDLFGRSLPEAPDAEPVAALRRYLESGRSPSARRLSQKAAVILDPAPLRGSIAWPSTQP